jgi:hypothetical protein
VAAVTSWQATDVAEFHVTYNLVGMGHFSWRCTCGDTDTVPTLSEAVQSGQAHREAGHD